MASISNNSAAVQVDRIRHGCSGRLGANRSHVTSGCVRERIGGISWAGPIRFCLCGVLRRQHAQQLENGATDHFGSSLMVAMAFGQHLAANPGTSAANHQAHPPLT